MTTEVLAPRRAAGSSSVGAESLCLPRSGMGLGDVLQVADVLRRRLARNTRGREGSFAGFDDLDVAGWANNDPLGPILLTAVVVDQDRISQTVEYTAGPCDHSSGRHREVGCGAMMRGRGRTVDLGSAAPAQDLQAFTKAPLRR